jgi:isohexenylglutaconyl-CoA hydratase
MGEEATVVVQRSGGVLQVTLNQPATRNALSGQMVQELRAVAAGCVDDASVRCVVLRGAGGNFCAGGNFADFQQMMQSATTPGAADPIAVANREFGRMLQDWCALPQPVIAVVEGAAMGGGFGLVAISDIALAEQGARFAMPETSLGLPPAQIAPFVARRIGVHHARRLALTAVRLDALEARALGLVDELADGVPALEQALQATLDALLRCAPRALAATKAILGHTAALDDTLDFAAEHFALALRNGDAAEGVRAFSEKRLPHWTAQKQS